MRRIPAPDGTPRIDRTVTSSDRPDDNKGFVVFDPNVYVESILQHKITNASKTWFQVRSSLRISRVGVGIVRSDLIFR